MEPTDSELLMRFTRHRQSDALELLLEKHAGMVLGVCMQILQDRHDAEDAFQATFLILAQQAHKIQRSSSVGAWLHRVAYRTAMRSAKQRQKRRLVESLEDSYGNEHDPWVSIAQKEEQSALHAALDEMPTRLRSAIVLCYLQGRTRNQAADELETTEAAIKSRLARGKQMLRTRLARRGVMLSAAMLAATTVTTHCKTAAANSLIAATTQTCAATVLQNSNEVFTTQIGSLAKQGIQTMQMVTLSKVAIIACLVMLPGITWSLYSANTVTAADGVASAVDSSTVSLKGDARSSDEDNSLKLVFAEDRRATSGAQSAVKEDPRRGGLGYDNPDARDAKRARRRLRKDTASEDTTSEVTAAEIREMEFAIKEFSIERDYRLAKLEALAAMKESKQANVAAAEADIAHHVRIAGRVSEHILSEAEKKSKQAAVLQFRAEELEIDAEILKLKLEAELFRQRIETIEKEIAQNTRR